MFSKTFLLVLVLLVYLLSIYAQSKYSRGIRNLMFCLSLSDENTGPVLFPTVRDSTNGAQSPPPENTDFGLVD